ILLGIDPAQGIEVKGELDYMPEDLDLNREITLALEKRPALKEIGLQGQAARARVKAAFSGYLPRVSLSFTDYANQKETFSAGREKYDDYWIAGLTVRMSLFDGFLTRSKIKEAKAKEEKLRILKDKLIDSTKIEVKNAVLDLETAKSIVESQEENVTKAKEAYDIIRRRYALGEAAQLDLLDVQVALSTAQINHAQSLYDFITAGAKLNYVAGKGEE
ncbi:MAG: TolC family protein, partial [Candidatus Omnitrophica bacterium]|nr:TolC family protein [Candidatus Omnitrophota bacterium]